MDTIEKKQRADLERNRIDRLSDFKARLDREVLEERGKLEYKHKECLEQLRRDLEAKHSKVRIRDDLITHAHAHTHTHTHSHTHSHAWVRDVCTC